MPRLSREVVAKREDLARALFREGKPPHQVQAELMKVDVGGGKTGVKMNPPRLAELEAEVKGAVNGNLGGVRGVGSGRVPATETTQSPEPLVNEPDHYEGEIPSYGKELGEILDAEEEEAGIIPVNRCVVGALYQDLETPSLFGRFKERHAGLYCFQMDDGRTFKLWHDEKVRVA